MNRIAGERFRPGFTISGLEPAGHPGRGPEHSLQRDLQARSRVDRPAARCPLPVMLRMATLASTARSQRGHGCGIARLIARQPEPSAAVQAGTPKTISETLTNSGGTSLTISPSQLSGAGFTVTGLTLPLTLAAGQSTTFTVTFTPTSGGAAAEAWPSPATLPTATLNIPLVGKCRTAGVLSTSDSSLNFGSVQVNGTGTQPETLTNTGGTSVTITQAKVSGTGFSVTGLNLPLDPEPGTEFHLRCGFNPTSGGSASGSIVRGL